MDQFASRRNIIAGIILLAALSLVIRLFYLQVIDTSYKLSAENNSKRIEVLYPARGLIYDRNKRLLVYNQPAYDLMIAPYELKPFDTVELAGILGMDIARMRAGVKKAFGPKFRREPFVKQLSPENYAKLQEKLYKFPGFYVRSRTLRRYNKEFAAHLFGYVGEVDERIMAANSNYALGDYIGISGIEGYYEKYLEGHKGQEVLLVDVHGRVKGPYQGGRFDEDAIVGKNLVSTIDGNLQEYGEKLMSNFRGSVVAIEPSTGEILTLISAPSYNPSLLVGRQRTTNYAKLQADPQMPLFNRALMANYPPGSTFKPFEALVGLQEGVISTASTFSCSQGFFGRGISMRCHEHSSPLDLVHGIMSSCNAYFCNVFLRIMENPKYKNAEQAYRVWRDYALSFGFGNRLNSDFNNELKGFIAPVSYYDKYYGANHWNAITINSLSIGQGEVLLTPLQMANMAATIANRGYYITPHVIKQIEGIDTIESRFYKKHVIPVDTQNFGIVARGMELAVNGGAGSTAGIARLPDIVVCGKTGTAQNPHGQPHSVFIAFAPKNNPKIAILVFVENGNYGATYAAPIASLMIEKYLTDSISPTRKWIEDRMLNSNLLYSNDR
jgi:penicillin-binding protein 2